MIQLFSHRNLLEGICEPKLTFGHLLMSGSCDDPVKKTTGERNGHGEKLKIIPSTKLIIQIASSRLHATVSFLIFRVCQHSDPQRGFCLFSNTAMQNVVYKLSTRDNCD